jgi:membrane protein
VVFYGLLALFPAVTAMVSLYGLFAKASTINEHLSAATNLLPESGVSIVRDQINRLAAKGDAKLGFGFVAGLAIALWRANSGMKGRCNQAGAATLPRRGRFRREAGKTSCGGV